MAVSYVILAVKESKCVGFGRKIKGVPRRKICKYLGYRINDTKEAHGKINIAKEFKTKAKRIVRVGKGNQIKGLQLLTAVCGGTLNFYSDC